MRVLVSAARTRLLAQGRTTKEEKKSSVISETVLVAVRDQQKRARVGRFGNAYACTRICTDCRSPRAYNNFTKSERVISRCTASRFHSREIDKSTWKKIPKRAISSNGAQCTRFILEFQSGRAFEMQRGIKQEQLKMHHIHTHGRVRPTHDAANKKAIANEKRTRRKFSIVSEYWCTTRVLSRRTPPPQPPPPLPSSSLEKERYSRARMSKPPSLRDRGAAKTHIERYIEMSFVLEREITRKKASTTSQKEKSEEKNAVRRIQARSSSLCQKNFRCAPRRPRSMRSMQLRYRLLLLQRYRQKRQQ
uniref:Uncharacterized protein n=1 Tax=Trichogramma kaykai TaxID=54128 RepID=A0ABD2XBN5_9HYME